MGLEEEGFLNFGILAKNLEMAESDYLEIVKLFVESALSDLSKLQSAMAEEGDMKKARIAAHSIKGAAGNLGLMEISDVAKGMEKNILESNRRVTLEMMQTLREKLDQITESLRVREREEEQ